MPHDLSSRVVAVDECLDRVLAHLADDPGHVVVELDDEVLEPVGRAKEVLEQLTDSQRLRTMSMDEGAALIGKSR